MDEASGTSGDDHPHADIRVGQSFVNQIYRAVTTSPQWSRTVLVITYDEWGGFFDHVSPPTAPDANPACRLRGFRVPTMVISPYARRHHVAHGTYDHTSILKMIEWRWSLAPLTLRDAHARNLAEVLDFARPSLVAPVWTVPPAVGKPCVAADPAEFADWRALAGQAARSGFAPAPVDFPA
jgi:phospholipase C